jgi:hypothetical protein
MRRIVQRLSGVVVIGMVTLGLSCSDDGPRADAPSSSTQGPGDGQGSVAAPESSVHLLSAGSGEREAYRYRLAAGDSWRRNLLARTEFGGDEGLGSANVSVSITVEVSTVATDGTTELKIQVTDAAISDVQGAKQPSDAAVGALAELSMTVVAAPDGDTLSSAPAVSEVQSIPDPAVQSAVDLFTSVARRPLVPLPEQEIGDGAAWSSTSQGVQGPGGSVAESLVFTYTLLDGDAAAANLGVQISVGDDDVSGTDGRQLTVTGDGELHWQPEEGPTGHVVERWEQSSKDARVTASTDTTINDS